MSNKQPLKYSEVPSIERYLEPEDFHKVVPIDMYPEYIQSIVTLSDDKLSPTLRIVFNPEVVEGVQNELIIPTAMLNSQLAGVETPLFLFENSTRKLGVKPLEYFSGPNNSDERVLNMNQMVYLFIQHRLAYFKRVAVNKKIYLDLLRNKDLKELKSFIEYQKPVAFNSLKKVENTYVIINNVVFNIVKDNVIGERIKGNGFSEEDWQLIMRDLYSYVVPTSESSFNEKCKLVLSPSKKSIYRGPAFSFEGDVATSIFPFKPNIVARLKTHITGNGIELANPDKSCFKHDLIFENGNTKLLDATTKYVTVIFHPMDFETKRFVAGELEASESVARTLVTQQEHITVVTDDPDNLSVQEGVTYYPQDKPFDLTTVQSLDPLTQEPIDNCIYGITNFTVKYIKPLGNNIVRVTIDKTMKAGNARVISKTGLKGVTNVTGKDRHVYFAPIGKTAEDLQDPNTRDTILKMRTRKLKQSHPNYEFLHSVNGELEQINSVSYKTVNPKVLESEGWSRRKVDIVTGMNAVKAKTNTIRLAQALLAVEMGYYTPTPKGKNGIYEGILDASNELEINQSADSLPDFIYLDENNVPNKCYVGLVPINFTELGKTYAKFKKQSFSFESGNVIKSVHPELFDYIFSNYLEEDKKDVCLELYEIYEDFNGKLGFSKGLPVMKLADIRKNIKPTDLFLSSQTRDIVDSILFNTDFNPNGFIIDVCALAKKADASFKTQLIRVPSANTLRYFMSVRNDGTYMYDPLLRCLSRIFMPLLGYRNLKDMEEEQNQNKDFVPYYYLFGRKGSSTTESYQTALDLYKSMLKGTVYSSADSSKQLTQSLIKPKIPGFSLKQVVNSAIPSDSVVLLNDHLRKKTFNEAGKGYLLEHDSYYNGILDIAIMVNTNQERIDIKDALIEILDEVPLLIVNRNPFLWRGQQTVRKFYGYREFKAYLNVFHNTNLDDMLSSKFNRDVVYLPPMTVLEAKADVDGDLSVCFVLDEEGQALLHIFKDLDLKICEEEKNWIRNYIKGEYESNADLILDWQTKFDKDNKPLDFKYKIYTMPIKYNMVGNKHIETYAQYLINAGIAKSNVGPSTIDCWLIKAIFQVYEALFKEFGGVSVAKNSGETIRMVQPFSEELRTKLEFTYVRLVQERVVEGIKHMAGGSSSFKIYYLQNITEKSNEKLIKKQLTEEYDLTAHEVERFLSILSFVKSYRGLLSASSAFIKKYNKGKLPTTKEIAEALEFNEEYLMLHTYFGSLVTDLYDISQEVKKLKDVSTSQLKQGHKQNSNTNLDTFDLTDIL